MSKKSQDIRSFFTVVSKKTVTSPEAPKKEPETKKRRKTSKSSDEVKSDSPDKAKKAVKAPKTKKLRRVIVLSSSESEDEKPKDKGRNGRARSPEPVKTNGKEKSPVPKAGKEKSPKKGAEPVKCEYISALAAFGDSPVVQTKVKSVEHQVHNDEDFEKTLMELDDEELIQNAITPSKVVKEEKKSAKKTPQKKKSETDSDVIPETPSRKRKISETDDSGTDPDLLRFEKKRYSAMLYQKYLNRKGPSHLGSKILPKGKPDCLKGCVFVITGVLDSLTREDAADLIKSHGGTVCAGVTKKVNYVLYGEDAGPAKMEKAQNQNAHTVNEDELLDLICQKSGIVNENATTPENGIKIEAKDEEDVKTELKMPDKSNSKEFIKTNGKETTTKESTSTKRSPEKQTTKKPNLKKLQGSSSKPKLDIEIKKEHTKSEVKTDSKPALVEMKKETQTDADVSKPKKIIDTKPIKFEKTQTVTPQESLSWVDKYKPKVLKDIIGQQGEKGNAQKLVKWMRNWYKNHDGKTKLVRPSPWAKDNDGAFFKAALLSGPPGVGKTTTATIVSKELGFDVVEFNASNTRNKKMLHEEVSNLLKTTSLHGYFTKGTAPTKKHVLLMDEVDGMSGNEDRGGMQELISLIKDSSIPIICMCNDRQHPKIRSLANHCFDLRFAKPRLEQIKGQMMSICFKENVDIKSEALNQVILGAGMDIRQTLNNLSMWSAGDSTISTQTAEKEAKSSQKDTKLGPWEVIRKVFTKSEHETMNLTDKFRLFFHDYSIGPLFVQENYLQVMPDCKSKDILKCVAKAADSISIGDVIDKQIRSNQNWALLEMEALFGSVLPGEYMKGYFKGQINFPGWLGKNSKRTKMQRLVSEVQSHMRTSISGSRQAVHLDYAPHIRDAVITPLVENGQEGIPDALEAMKNYNLLREDVTSLVELTQWPKTVDKFARVDSKVKAAFTRAYNKDGGVLPYATSAPIKKKRGATQEDDYADYEEEEESEPENDDVTNDAMIKAKKTATKGDTKNATKAETSKKKAPAKPRAKKVK